MFTITYLTARTSGALRLHVVTTPTRAEAMALRTALRDAARGGVRRPRVWHRGALVA